MYKVFVNEKVIYFTKTTEKCEGYPNVLTLRFFHQELTEFLIELLTKAKRIDAIFIVTGQPQQDFEQFKQHFQLITAAGGVVKNQTEEFLLIYRMDKWDLPKGKLEGDETLKEGAIREVEEECGIDGLTITGELPATYHVYELKGEMVLKISYWYAMTTSYDGALEPQLEEQITAVKWMSKTEIKEQALLNTYASIKDLLVSAIL